MPIGEGYHVGDCRELLKQLPRGSVQTCVTSPPFWGLRDYGEAAQLGLEPTPEAYVCALVKVFRQVWRVLADDGTLWLNLGDCYITNPRGPNSAASSKLTGTPDSERRKKRWQALPHPKDRTTDPKSKGRAHTVAASRGCRTKLKHKDLVGIPWRVAFALQDDGWWLRSDIIWHKPAPMPDSTRDRPTRAHEYVFLLAKQPRYYYDDKAIREPAVTTRSWNKARKNRADHGGVNDHDARQAFGVPWDGDERNRRSVWTIGTERSDEEHFAAFPEDLVNPCILAGSRPGDLVLDPFGGTGTVARVAEDLGRRWCLMDLSPKYAEIARRRMAQKGLLGLAVAKGA